MNACREFSQPFDRPLSQPTGGRSLQASKWSRLPVGLALGSARLQEDGGLIDHDPKVSSGVHVARGRLDEQIASPWAEKRRDKQKTLRAICGLAKQVRNVSRRDATPREHG